MKYDAIIVGAGAAGLMAMKELIGCGYKVCMLEAASIMGGRIATLYNEEWKESIEAGAEFIHGDLPLTMQLLNEAGISCTEVEGEMVNVKGGVWLEEEQREIHWPQFTRQLQMTKDDMTIRAFLEKYFGASQYAGLRRAVQGFAEGFDLADISKASLLAVKNEWQHQSERQYRVDGGYSRLVNYLAVECKRGESIIVLNACVVKVEHKRGNVHAHMQNGKMYEASKIVITAPAGILQSGAIRFEPEIPDYYHAIQQLGFGTVIKFLLYFKTNFWKDIHESTGFLLSDEQIPTWWTQLPHQNNLLTGWLGGPPAAARSNERDESLLTSALLSLSNIFHRPLPELRNNLAFHHIFCWHNSPYIKGGYTYDTVESVNAKKILSQPVNDTIYFAGEALYNGGLQGTVEAALQTGKAAAHAIFSSKE